MTRAIVDRAALALFSILVALGVVDAESAAHAPIAAVVLVLSGAYDTWRRKQECQQAARAILRAAELPADSDPCEDIVLMHALRKSSIPARLLDAAAPVCRPAAVPHETFDDSE